MPFTLLPGVHYRLRRPLRQMVSTSHDYNHDILKPVLGKEIHIMAVPAQLPTGIRNEAYGGVTYHIEGELVPVLHVELGHVPVYFEHHILLWKDPAVQIGVKPLKGAFKRIMSGMPIFMTMATGPGRIAFSRDGVGHVFPFHLDPGQSLDVREHQFLAATDTLDYTFTRVKGVANMLFGGTGFFIDTFYSPQY